MDAILAALGIVGLMAAGAAGWWGVRTTRRAGGAERLAGDAASRLGADLAQAEEERRSLHLALDSMDEGVVLFDADGRVRLANPAAEALLGSRPRASSTLFPLELRRAVASAAELDEPAVTTVDVGTPPRSIRATATRVGPDGSVLLVLLDVTESRRLDAVRRDFITNASHELKTPAASIQAAAETIRAAASDDPEVVPRFAEQLEREAARLSRIVSDLLDLSRLESGSETVDLVRLDEVLADERERFERAAEEAGVTLRLATEPVPPVRGSARDLSLLVRNLVDNAVRYTRAGGRVDVRVGAQDGLVVLVVADTGVGIPSRDLDRIFERFYRVDRARSRELGGTGLGLAIVKHLVIAHGGTLAIESQPGRGTTVRVGLPPA